MSIFMSVYLLVCRYCISNQWIAEEIDEKKSPLLFLMNPEFHNKRTVLTPSFRPKRSGVEKSHTEAGRAPWWQEISRLSISINSKAFAPILAGPPLEIRMSMSSIQSFSGGSTDQNAAPPPSFRPKRSGVEKSHTEAGRAPWWQEISRLSISINSKAFAPILAGPPLEIRMSMSSIQSFSGGSTDQNAAPPPSFRRSERSGEISRRSGANPMVAGNLPAQCFNKLQSLYPHIGRSPARDKDVDEQHPVIFRGIN